MNGINKKYLNDPIEWYTRSQWFIGAAKLITEKNNQLHEDWDQYEIILANDAYNTVPWLSFMAIECVLKGLLVANGYDSADLKHHDLKKYYNIIETIYPKILDIQNLEFFIKNYSDYVFSNSGGNRYPEKMEVPIFDTYWETAEILRRFAKSKL